MSIAQWQAMHAKDKAIADKGTGRLLFLGDSITAGWDQEIWQQYFSTYTAVNMGIGGDKTQNVLWRLQNGGAGKLQPELIVLMIGVNNFGHDQDSAEDVARGVKQILRQTAISFPSAKVLLLGILPYGEEGATTKRKRLSKANLLLSELADNSTVFFKDFGTLFLDEKHSIPKALMGDFLHPTKKGYQILARALAPHISALMSGSYVKAIDPKLSRVGRGLVTENGGWRTGYPGTSFVFNYQGSDLSMTANSSSQDNYLDIFVNGSLRETLLLEKGRRTYAIINGKKSEAYKIELLKRSETWHGTLEVENFYLGDGKLLPPPTLPQRKIMIIGDSVSCGEAIDREANCQKTPGWWNPKQSYGMLLGEHFKAQTHLICYGGRGLIRSWNGKTDEANAAEFFQQSLALAQDAPQWDHHLYQPDLILISLGTNDFSLGIGELPEEEAFVPAYLDFIKELRSLHPHAKIAITEGAMVNDQADPARPQKKTLRKYLEKTVQLSEGEVVYLRSNHHPGDRCDTHPTKAQHKLMAEELAEQIKKIMPW